jgi:hypothetical protein
MVGMIAAPLLLAWTAAVLFGVLERGSLLQLDGCADDPDEGGVGLDEVTPVVLDVRQHHVLRVPCLANDGGRGVQRDLRWAGLGCPGVRGPVTELVDRVSND